MFRSSPKVEAIIQRLRYVGEHVFGGDIEAYGEAVGFTKPWMHRILNSTARLRLSTFTQFVESGVVSAEWLFCGTGPMSPKPPSEQETFAAASRAPATISGLDTTLIAPAVLEQVVAAARCKKHEPAPASKYIPDAEHIFAANAAGAPVVLYLDAAALKAGCGPIVCEFLRNKWITAVILPCSAVAIDTERSAAELGNLLRTGAAAGLGAGEIFGRYCRRPESVLATAHDLRIPGLVHVGLGNSLMHMIPVTDASSFGAAIGSTGYVDMLAIAELMWQVVAKPIPGCILLTSGANSVDAVAPLLETMRQVSRNLATPPRSPAVVLNQPVRHPTDAGNYCVFFSELYTACEVVYKGLNGWQH